MFTLYYRSHSDLEADLLLVGHLTCLTVPFVLSCRTVQKKVVHARARRGLTPEFLSRIKRCAQSSPRSKSRSTNRTENAPLVPHHPNVLQRAPGSKSALAWSPIYNPQQTPEQNHPLQTRPLSTLAPRCHTLLVLWSEAQSFSVKERYHVAGLLNGVRRASVGRPNVWAMEFFVGKTPDRFKCMRVYEPRNGQKQDHIFN